MLPMCNHFLSVKFNLRYFFEKRPISLNMVQAWGWLTKIEVLKNGGNFQSREL
jgi:hypothetical protein